MINLIPSNLVLLAYQATTGAPTLDARPGAAATGEGAPAGGTATAPAASDGGAGMGSTMMIMLLIVGAMIIFSLMGGRKDKKRREQMLSGIKKHDRVLTVGGIVGSVVEMKDDTVILKVDEQSNTRITFSKTAISQVLAGTTAE
jgi:preprotein translocase subunit YajC